MATATEPAPAKAPRGDSPDDVKMTFGQHLEELRWRLIKSVLMLAVCVVACLFIYEPLLYFITRPHFEAMKLLGVKAEDTRLMSLGYTAPIWAVMKLAFIIGVFLASPFIAYELWAFVSAGLYRHEKKWVRIFSPMSFLLFTGGCTFGYFVLIPYGLYGMAAMMKLDVVSQQYALKDYLDLVMTLTLATGAIFQLPLVMCFTTAIGLTTARTYWTWIRFAVVAIFVAAAILTPSPDMYTQCLMAAPLLVLYFIGMGLSALIRRTPKT